LLIALEEEGLAAPVSHRLSHRARISESCFARRLLDARRAPMQTECKSSGLFGFEAVRRAKVIAAFDGGAITSDAGGALRAGRDGFGRSGWWIAGSVLCRMANPRREVDHSYPRAGRARLFRHRARLRRTSITMRRFRHDPVWRCWRESCGRDARTAPQGPAIRR